MQPNYIHQLNAFNRWLDTHYLSPHAQLLWFRMIGLFNSCGWAESVQINARRLMTLAGTESNTTAYRARDALVEAGLLSYEKGRKGKPSRYRMRFFPCLFRTEYETASDTGNEPIPLQKTTHRIKKKEKPNENQNQSVRIPPELETAWSAYARMRAQIAKPVTDDAVPMLLAYLERLAPHNTARQSEILNRSTMHGWQGLFPLPDADDPPPRSYDLEEMERRLWEDPIPVQPAQNVPSATA